MSKPKISGTYFVVGSTHIKVKTDKILAKNIQPRPPIINGIMRGNEIEEVKSATIPIFVDDAVNRLEELMRTNNYGAADVFGKPKKKEDATLIKEKFRSLLSAITLGLSMLPLKSYSRGYVDATGVQVSDVRKFILKDDKLVEFPYLEKTHLFQFNDYTMQPRIYWDEMLQAGDYVYEFYAEDDDALGRKALYDLAVKMDAWIYAAEGHPKKGQTEEVMAVIEGTVLQSGSSQEYIALLAPKRIVSEEGEDKFVFVAKLCQSNVQYGHVMSVPKEEELKASQQPMGKPIAMKGFAEMLAHAKA